MDKLFLTILNMSLTGSLVIVAVIATRLLLKKAPKYISYFLWAVVAFRLVFPFSIESVLSLMPFNAQPIPQDIAMQAVPRIDSGIPFINSAVSSVLPAAEPAASVNPLQIWTFIGSWIWITGFAVMFMYGVVSFLILKRKMREAAYVEENVYEAENIKSPFVLGFFKPTIYLPFGLSEQERSYILLHEQTHIKRHDHIVKFGAYFILCLHWFNPLAWAAFLLMGADMEMSCDESVLKQVGEETKKDYSRSLLSMAMERHIISGSPLAFGEGGVQGRIKNVLNFRKTSRVIVLAAVTFVVVLSVGFAMDKRIDINNRLDIQLDSITKIELQNGSNGDFVEITDYATIQQITYFFTQNGFTRTGFSSDYTEWPYYGLKFYTNDYLVEETKIINENLVDYGGYIYTSFQKGDIFYDITYLNGVFDNAENDIRLPELNLHEIKPSLSVNGEIKTLDDAVNWYLHNVEANKYLQGHHFISAYHVLDVQETSGSVTIYAHIICRWLTSEGEAASGGAGLVSIVFNINNDNYIYVESMDYIKPSDYDLPQNVLDAFSSDTYFVEMRIKIENATANFIAGETHERIRPTPEPDLQATMPPFDVNVLDNEEWEQTIGLSMNLTEFNASGLSFYIEHKSDNNPVGGEFIYGDHYKLYVFKDNTWVLAEPIIDWNWAFFDIGYSLPSQSRTKIITVDWEWCLGELPSGDYKFQKNVNFWRSPGDFDTYLLEQNFTLP